MVYFFNLLMVLLDTCHNTGLEVVATLCDMDANSVKALKHLCVSEKTPFFRFQNQEVGPIFDLSTLLKDTGNLFLQHAVANVECEITVKDSQLTGTKWGNIVRLYAVDKCNVSCLLPKVTERLMKP
jgi:hypothetical protein